MPAGTYSLTARATDDDGATTTSAARTVTVNRRRRISRRPSSLTAPANGATFTAPGDDHDRRRRRATPTARSTRVDFYQGTTLIGSDTTSPYSFTWSNVPAGTYSLTAGRTDNAGATTTSAARSGDGDRHVAAGRLDGRRHRATGGGGSSAPSPAAPFTVEARGIDISDTTDRVPVTSIDQLTGDIEITSPRRLARERRMNSPKAGVMIREALTGNAAHISLVVTPATGPTLYERPTAGDVTSGRRGAGRARRPGSGSNAAGDSRDGVPVERRGDMDVRSAR